MATATRHDAWQAGDSYEAYMGRWSRRIAPLFLQWLEPDDGLDWLELGCGTGALTAEILRGSQPSDILALEPSEGFLAAAANSVDDARVTFRQGGASDLGDLPSASRDIAVSGLVLNFLPDPLDALRHMARIVRPGGSVAFYVWDYPGGGVEFMRAFWSAAVALDPAAKDLTETGRFPFCTQDGLLDLAQRAGLDAARVEPLSAPTVFADFEDYWRPFTLGAGPAPGYCAALPAAERETLRVALRDSLPRQPDGSIALTARAWAGEARVP